MSLFWQVYTLAAITIGTFSIGSNRLLYGSRSNIILVNANIQKFLSPILSAAVVFTRDSWMLNSYEDTSMLLSFFNQDKN